jgi:hypothetical protein
MSMSSRIVLFATLSLALCGSLSASTVFDLTYTDVAGGPSFGVGQVTIEDSALVPFNSIFTNAPTSFIDSFSVTFFNFPNNSPLTFGLAQLGAAFLTTDASGNITDINFWSYDRIGLGTNTCPPCTVPYLAGVSTLTGTVTDPVNNNLLVEYSIGVTQTPEPSSSWLLLVGLLGVSARIIEKKFLA